MYDVEQWLEMSPQALFAEVNDKSLVLAYVATRDIEVGEELFIDYGDEWQNAWDKHVAVWTNGNDDDDTIYISAAEYTVQNKGSRIHTLAEQELEPYPDNIQTACYYSDDVHTHGCWHPCDVTGHSTVDGDDVYLVHVYNVVNMNKLINVCAVVPQRGLHVADLPASRVAYIDKPYSSDMHLAAAFCHEIVFRTICSRACG